MTIQMMGHKRKDWKRQRKAVERGRWIRLLTGWVG